jgi:phage terminase large subunit-like protein
VRALFGSLDPYTKQRMIRELFILVAKKNSKSTYSALLMLTALLLNERPRASLIMTAPVHDVAQLAFDAAAGAIALDPVLEKKFHVRDHLKTIIHRETKAELQIMTFDPSVLTGQKPVAALIDELHVVAGMGKSSSAIRQLRGGMLPFPEAFLAFITTQSENAPSGVFASELKTARSIRDGKQTGAMLPVLYEFPDAIQRDEEKWRDSTNWWMVTPNRDRSISIPRLVEDMHTAEMKGKEELRAWASQHLNLEIGLSLKSDSWAGAEFWEAQADPKLTLDTILKKCDVLTIGIDGGGLDDMFSLAVIGRESETGDWLHWSHSWIHPIAMERRKKEADRYYDFERDGDLTIVKNVGEDLKQIGDVIWKCFQSDLVDQIGLDPASIGALLDELENRGIPKDRIIGISQGWKMVGAIKTAERKLAEGELWHGNSRLMAWAVGNAKVEPRGNAIIITKQAAGYAKIDPLMAMLNAITLMALNPAPRNRESVFFL